MRPALLLLALAACHTFEDPDIVVDLRVLAITADPPEQVIDVDLSAPDVNALLGQLVPAEVCALVADPGRERALAWSFTLCALESNERCDEDAPMIVLRDGVMPDPETTPAIATAERMCAPIVPDGNLLTVVMAAYANADFGGLGGIDYGVSLAVVGADEPLAPAEFAGKNVRVSARIPAARTANTNPTLDGLDASVDDAPAVRLPLGRCVEQTAPLVVAPEARVRLTPVESATARETYVVPTLDGMSRTFTEALTYQWVAGAGGFSAGSTGGPRDISGNPAPLFTDFRAPKADAVGTGVDVPVWVVQRDERLGAQFYESCIRVQP